MGSHFPLEILFQIAEFIEPCKRTPFTPYTLVCRRWQAAFEPLIYKRLNVCSDGFGVASGTLSLSQFQSMTSGAASRISRRYMIQSISYRVAVPYKLMDYHSIVPADGLEHYMEDNTVRNSNDEAFKNGMADLFNTLASWSGDHQFSLSLRVMGCKKTLEPGTRDILSADEDGRIKDGDTVVQPYRARFPDGKCELRDVTCIRELIFSSGHWIWVGAAMHIARCCTRLDGLFWDTYEFVKRDNLHYMQARRQAFADGLPHLPGTLKRLEYTNAAEGPYRASRPSLASEGADLLSLNLQWMSTRLEELRLSGVFVSPEFLWPLDEQAKPIRTHIEWPNLRVLVVKQGQRFILSADTPEFELMYLAFGRREILNMRDIPSYKPSNKFSETDAELCHRAMISMGCAVHHMPRLQTINYDFPVNIFASFRLARDHEACSFQAAWMFDDEGCKPDHRVASAWGFSLGALKTTLAPGFGMGLKMLYEVDYRM